MESLAQVLRQIPLFSSLGQETLEALSKCASTHSYAGGEIIQQEGEVCAWAAFVISGSVQVCRLTLSGREQIYATLGQGMLFNAVPALERQGRVRATVKAITDTRLLLVPAENYRSLLQTRPDLAFAVLTTLSERVDQLADLVEKLSLHSVRGRLARFLIDQADQGKDNRQWTQDEIAAHLGTVRDVIGRILRTFMDDGLIRREGGRLVLVDRKRLEEEALL